MYGSNSPIVFPGNVFMGSEFVTYEGKVVKVSIPVSRVRCVIRYEEKVDEN